MTQRSDALRGVEQQLLALVTVPGRPAAASALTGPKHLFRAVASIQRDGAPQPQVGVDSDGDLQARWTVGATELVLTVEDRGAGYLWALGADGTELLYAEWSPSEQPLEVWRSASDLLAAPSQEPCAAS
ncbi:hypothetical protein FHN55_06030 [Streptomyces sp. NP160]|uniref:hypothetical protein n=1 Tax=Streptomyces sp. NP160 TaxID=2586637 RepID=UPI00111B0B31|nr:hypothetical protein [Streptomyces sp. NP160]TNM68764.1 hypothetical protein FHN55_06030 [Streptomyces sp. NP160]